ncbi:MAG: zf-HC2 domain-containing protein, partial [Actinobacteria bacterium]|nr:zf-HC2 domain-containing protein [Actinomycetota bacterium]
AADSGLRALRDPGHLRPWLFAMARGVCHRRLSERAAPGGTGDAPGRTGAAGDAQGGTPAVVDASGWTGAADGAQAATAAARDARAGTGDAGGAGPLALVRAALPALTAEEREVAELSLRYELAGDGLARVLGVSGRRARAAAARAQDAFGRALRAALVARTGRGSCPELARMLADWDGALTAPLREQILAHAAGCRACGPRSRRELAAGVLLSMLPVLTAPAGLRDQVLRVIAGESPAAVAYRARVARRAGPYDRAGFPRQPGPPPAAARRLKTPVATTAAVVALAIVGGSTLLATELTGQPRPGSAGPRGRAAPRASPPPSSRPGSPPPSRCPGRPGPAAPLPPGVAGRPRPAVSSRGARRQRRTAPS